MHLSRAMRSTPPSDSHSDIPVYVVSVSTDTYSERNELRDEILRAIEPNCEVNKKPPFSVGELTVMACVCNVGWCQQSKTEILHWILATFRYYGLQSIRDYAGMVDDEERNVALVPEIVVPDFHEVFNDYNVPLEDADKHDAISIYNFRTITVSLSKARIFLSHILALEPKGVIPFLKLPAELRNDIYDRTFTFPKSGIWASSSHSPSGLCTLERDGDELMEHGDLDELRQMSGAFPLQPMDRILALLVVNKQIYREAMPFFYRENNFHLPFFSDMVGFFSRLPIERCRHLTDLEIHLNCNIDSGRMEKFPEAMARLASVNELKKLEIDARDSAWLEMKLKDRTKLGRKTKFSKIEQVSGFKDLAVAASKAKGLVFAGDCPLIKAYVEEQIGKIKAEAAAATQPKMKDKRTTGKKRVRQEERNQPEKRQKSD